MAGYRMGNFSSKAAGLRSKIALRASSIAPGYEDLLLHSRHLQRAPQVVEEAKHWQYNLRHLDFLQVQEPPRWMVKELLCPIIIIIEGGGGGGGGGTRSIS